MKRLFIALILLCFSVPCFAGTITIIKKKSGGTTEHLDTTIAGSATSNRWVNPTSAVTRGQSFQVTHAGTLTGIDVYFQNVGTIRSCTVRVCAGTDCSTTYQSNSQNAADGQYVKFTFSSPINVSTSTTYSWAIHLDAGSTGDVGMAYADAAYASGQELISYDNGSWNLNNTELTSDLRSRIYVTY